MQWTRSISARRRLHPLYKRLQRLAGRPEVTGVEAETDAEVSDLRPQPLDHLHLSRHGIAPSRCVLDQQRHHRLAGVQRLAPAGKPGVDLLVFLHVAAMDDHRSRSDLLGGGAGVGQDLAAGYADPVVGRHDVDQVRAYR